MALPQTLVPVVFFISWLYFKFVNVVFSLYYSFRERHAVSAPSNEILYTSATGLATLIRERSLTSSEIVEAYIERIQEVNELLNAVVEDNFDAARARAKEVDEFLDELDPDSEEAQNLHIRRPLLGVPFTVKDTIAVKGFKLTAGLVARADNVVTEDAEAIGRLFEAGAVLLCVSNVPEAAMWWETSNQLYGRTNNPYDTRRIVGGSSGGEGALLAAAGSVIGIGSDIGGSIRIPAIMNGVFGLKPSEGVVPLHGSFPPTECEFRDRMLNIGPMARHAVDLGLVLRVLVGPEATKLRLDEPVDLRRLRYFWMEGIRSPVVEHLHSSVRKALVNSVKFFEKKYSASAYKVDFPKAAHALELFHVSMMNPSVTPYYRVITNYEHDINVPLEFLRSIFGLSNHTVASLIMCVNAKLPGLSLDTANFIKSKRDQLRDEVINLLGDDGVLFFPSWPTTAPYHNQPLATTFNFLYTALWNTLRLPVVVVPLGLLDSSGLPLSVQVIGAPGSDRLLLAIAADLEEGFGGWVPPSSKVQG